MPRSQRIRSPWVLLVCAAILLTTSMFARASRPQRQPPVPPGTKRILFVGNSLTYGNDLPALVQALAAARKRSLLTEAVTLGGASLEDHWNDGKARRIIARGGWDVVVLQQGPSATEGRPVLLEYGRRFVEEIRKVKAAPAYYMVWPASDRPQDFDGVSESYRMAAEEANGYCFPVGEAWRAAWRLDPQMPLYGGDGFHPTREASYLAALVMVQELLGESPAGMPHQLKLKNGGSLSLQAARAKVLQQAAAEANEEFGRVPK
jgi:hypothetical protein